MILGTAAYMAPSARATVGVRISGVRRRPVQMIAGRSSSKETVSDRVGRGARSIDLDALPRLGARAVDDFVLPRARSKAALAASAGRLRSVAVRRAPSRSLPAARVDASRGVALVGGCGGTFSPYTQAGVGAAVFSEIVSTAGSSTRFARRSDDRRGANDGRNRKSSSFGRSIRRRSPDARATCCDLVKASSRFSRPRGGCTTAETLAVFHSRARTAQCSKTSGGRLVSGRNCCDHPRGAGQDRRVPHREGLYEVSGYLATCVFLPTGPSSHSWTPGWR
jgi:hypothetical protein